MTTPTSAEAVEQFIRDGQYDDRGFTHIAAMLRTLLAERDALRSALTASEKRQQWQPIETVPKGKRVLVAYDYHLTQSMEIKEYVTGHGFIWPSNAHIATHWMPLPEAP